MASGQPFFMDTFFIILSFIFVLIGIAGSFLPVIPGPPVAYLGLIFIQLTEKYAYSARFLWIYGITMALITLLDYLVPIYGTKRLGGTKAGFRGSAVGLIVGLFFGPPGIILGPLVGAFLGELASGQSNEVAIKSALGSFIGFLAGTVIKSGYGVVVLYQVIVKIV